MDCPVKGKVLLKRLIVKKDTYFDSVFLMQISAALKDREGVEEVQVTMATPQNIDLLTDLGFGEELKVDLTPNDLLIALSVQNESLFGELEGEVSAMLKSNKSGGADAAYKPSSIAGAVEACTDINMAIISVAGEYAANETRKALEAGLHVMLFSDNVSLEEEISLKKMALEKGLLVMGPDCGTAIINGSPLCFANEVRRGPVGIVAASGTGAQEVSVLIDRFGGGVSQLIGTGGRDLKEEVGGITMLMGIDALKNDPETQVILVVSKPPAKTVAAKIIEALKASGKPSVVHFIGTSLDESSDSIYIAKSLEDAALASLAAVNGSDVPSVEFSLPEEQIADMVKEEVSGKSDKQKYLRGYFTGGTLCDESLFMLSNSLGDIYSNIHTNEKLQLDDPFKSQEHTFVDLGDDTFTRGRPHPMIEPATRVERIEAEVDDEEIAVVMLDVVIGHGSHFDPAGEIVPSLVKARNKARERGGNLTILASVTGTDKDFQNYSAQRQKLEEIGAIVMPSNAQMSRLALKIAKGLEG
jgi:succinyl-CoA synthetase alpha subunit